MSIYYKPAGRKSVAISAGANLATCTAVVHIGVHILLTPVLPVVIAVLPPWVAHWVALTVATAGGAVRVGWALGTTDATIVAILACVSFTAILPVTIAVLPACVAHRVALAIAAAGGAVRVGWALGTADATVVGVHSYIGFTSILPIAIAVLPAWEAHWGALPIAARGRAVRVDWALDATPTAVVGVLACISLTTINPVAVAVLPTWVTHWVALAVAAGGGAEWVNWALDATRTAVVGVPSYTGFTPILPIAIAVLPAGEAHWGALAIAAAGGAVRVDWALDATRSAVVGVLSCISLTTIHPVAVAVLHS